LYPFGFGLSYTTFQYSNLEIIPITQHQQGDVEITFDVTNTGKMLGDEVVQLYISDLVSSVTTYESQLRGFERVTLAPCQTKTVKFILRPDDLALIDKNMNWIVEPGDFEIKIGSSSEDIRLKKILTIK
jgi:beta-glucosidase